MKAFLILLLAAGCVCLAEAAGTYNCSCDGDVCFSAVAEPTDYEASLKACRQRSAVLAAVRARQSSQVIAHLLENVKGEFWIGLELQDSVCSDLSSEMRGYNWATGGNSTDFTNWRDSRRTCAPRCVSVSSDLKWTERHCSGRIDGYICQGGLGSTCGRLEEQPNGVALYNTSYHANKAVCSVDAGSVAVSVPSGNKYICDGKDWVQAPWSCEVNKGGCDFECVTHDGSQCVCPSGKTVGGNGVSCVDDPRDPCFSLSCDHFCTPESGCGCRQGYELAEDGKLCRDIDECSDSRLCSDGLCVNTPGYFTCTCHSGFEMSDNKCVDIDECLSNPCDHECLNTRGSFSCSCFEDFIKVDELSCKYHCPKEECPAKCDPNNEMQCYCPEGFIAEPRDTGTVCVDINECLQNECEQNCVNTYGSYICSCENGYYLEDGFKCKKQDVGVYDFTTPTPPPPGNKTSSVSPGGLFAIIVCVVVMVLLAVLLLHLKMNSKWIFRGIRKNNSEDMKNLQQVTAEKDNMPLPDRHLPLNTC
ncbi:thrombomodulin [Paramormyrops kingsleyae]|uniref:thrombomodulin n=1 Tax=Paramormyrops kingsleyae TaxID=1676925 RepID=UPI000CD62C60|nr:thrombomodulin-like [Paramormyrops kingsleyae]